jgi:4-hydroxy-2-oxoheptanedioate aldolase
MKTPANSFTRALTEGRKQIGLWVSLGTGFSANIVAGAGFDWAVIDMEHAPNELHTVLPQLQVFAGSGTTAIVRPDWNDPVKVKRLLDLGAPGLLFPMVQSAEEARSAVAATRYPPRGIRGVSTSTTANAFGRRKDYFERVEEELTVIVQVETRAALERAPEIAAVDGVSGVFFGPADIGADLGLLGQPMAPEVWAAIRPVARALAEQGVPVGTLVGDLDFAGALLNDEFTFVACATDCGLLARAADAAVAKMRGLIG